MWVWAALPDVKRLRKFEADVGFGGQYDFFVPGERSSTGAGASTSCHSDSGTLTSAGQGPDDSAQGGPASGHHSRALAFTLDCESAGRSLYGHLPAMQGDGIQAKLKRRAAGKLAQSFGIDDGASHIRALWDHIHVVGDNVFRDRAIEGLT